MQLKEKKRLKIRLSGLELENPLLTASGTFGNGLEYQDFLDLNLLGGLVTKSVTALPRLGNATPRVAETPAGMLNAIGLQNEGLENFCENILPQLGDLQTRIIVSVAGKSIAEYAGVVERLAEQTRIDALEINISCPNVSEGGMTFGVCPQISSRLIKELRSKCRKPMLVKLSPNVTDITEIAKATEDAGADALVVCNTFLGMAVDIEKRKPILANITGGLSGPAIKPLALRLVWQVKQAVKVPIIGCGGISCSEDVIAFLLCGASAVEIGTMNFVEPGIIATIKTEMEEWFEQRQLSVTDIIDTLEV